MLHVVGIGASAGGLESLQAMLKHLDDDTGMAYVIVQHLSPDYESMMNQLLAKKTDLPITVVTKKEKLQPNHIYLISKDYFLTIDENHIRPTKRNNEGRSTVIDSFLVDLAESFGHRSIGVVLSGTGSDGTLGLRTIKEAGGIVLVQEPQEAQFDGMPNSAVATGVADFVLPIDQLARELNRIGETSQGLPHFPVKEGDEYLATDRTLLAKIISYLRTITKVDFSSYRTPTLFRRLEKRLKLTNNLNLADYLVYLKRNQEEAYQLVDDFFIGVSSFFRDKQVWKTLENEIVPALFEAKENDETNIRIWIAGCSTGEEAYTVGIIFQQYIDKHLPVKDFKIFATDIDPKAISGAIGGRFGEDIVGQVPNEILLQYFTHYDGEYIINKTIREKIVFTEHNLITDPAFIRMDLVSCRNTLIYLNQNAQQKIINKFAFSLKNGGHLILGLSESLGKYQQNFSLIQPHTNIFATVNPAPGAGTTNGQVPVNTEESIYKLHSKTKEVLSKAAETSVTPNFISDYYASVLVREYAPTAIFYNRNFDIQYMNGSVEAYLKFPKQYARMNLLELLTPDQQLIVRQGTQQVKNSNGQTAVLRQVTFNKKEKDKPKVVDIRFKEYWNTYLKQSSYMLEIIPNNFAESNPKALKKSKLEPYELNELHVIKAELKEKEQQILYLTDQLESNKEELQASNEELQANNEELQANNEELQSVNEELQTLNAELSQKVKEVVDANTDTTNLLSSADIPTLFLDTKLRIRRFTPSAKNIFNIEYDDVGRKLTHFTHKLVTEVHFEKNIQEVIDKDKRLEVQVQSEEGIIYIQRIHPYKNNKGQVTGAVVMYVDVTTLIKQTHLAEQYSDLTNIALSELYVADPETGKFINANYRALENLGYSLDELKELSPNHINPPHLHRRLEELLKEVLEGKRKSASWETQHIRKDGSKYDTYLTIGRLETPDGPVIAGSGIDISMQKQNEQRLNFVLESNGVGLWDWVDINDPEALYWSPELYRILGWDIETTKPSYSLYMERVHPDDVNRVEDGVKLHLDQNKPYDIEMRVLNPELGYQWYLVKGQAARDSHGRPYRFSGTLISIQDQKAAEIAREQAMVELKIANQYLDNFVYTAAHDLRQPVSNLRMITDIAKSDPQLHQNTNIQRFDTSVERLENTLSGLVQILEIQQLKSKESRKINFERLLGKVKEELDDMFEGVDAKWDINFEIEAITFIQPYLESILRNLISNAVKYRRPDQKLIVQISTQVTDMPDHVLLRIQDNGLGFDSERAGNKLFKPFSRLNKEIKGMGIGLYLIKTMVERNGGWVEVESRLNEGATFKVYLKSY